MNHEQQAQQIPLNSDYKRLTWNVLFGIGIRGENEALMIDKEYAVAQRILEWLTEYPEYAYYREYIKSVPYRHYLLLEQTNTLHFNLWLRTNASVWISPRDAISHTCLLWQFAIIRLSAYLNTGAW